MANQNDEKKESGAKAQTAENAAKPEGETTPVTEKKPAAKKSAAKSGAKKKPAAKKPAAPGSAAAKTSTAKSKAANGKNTARKKTAVSKGATGVKKSANAAQDFVRAEDAAQDAARKAEALPDTQDRVPAVETAAADELRQEDTAEAIGAMPAILEDTLSLQQTMTLDSPPFEADGKEGAQPEDLLEQMLKDKTVPEADASSGEAAQENEAVTQENEAAAQENKAAVQETQAAPASFMSRVRAWFAELAVDSIEPPKAVAAVAMQPVQTEEAAGNAKEDAQGAIKTEDAETDAQANVALAVDVTPEQEQEKDTKVVLPAEEPASVAVELSPQPEKAQETEESTAAEQKALEAEEDAVLPKTESASVSEKEEPEQEAVPESEPEQAATSEKNAKSQAAHKGTTGIFGSLKKLFQEAFAPIDEMEEDEKENASIDDAEFSILPILPVESAKRNTESVPEGEPTAEETEKPAAEPIEEPAAEETEKPAAEPTEEPAAEPTEEPAAEPTEEPTEEPTAEETEEPTAEPTEEPAAEPTEEPAAEETEEFYEDERPRHRVTAFKVFVSFTTILAVMTALFVVLLFVLSDNSLLSPKIEVDMPNFNGMEASQIKEDSKFSEFQIEYEDVYTEEAEKGIVIDQRPKAPRQVKENAHITLRVSAGIQTVEVPDVAGMSREEAKATLKKSNLNVLFKPVADDAVDEEDVVETDPKSGTVLNAGETVIVYISRGEQEAMTAKVPSCVGLASTSAAGQLLGSRGLTLGGVREVASGSPAGTVIGQSPPAGKVLPRGSGVTITVSTGAPVAVTAGTGNEVVGADGHVHQYVAQVVAPNSYSIGFTMHTCTICGYYYYDNVKNPV